MIYKPWNPSSSENPWSTSLKKAGFSSYNFINKLLSPKHVQAKKELQGQIADILQKKHRAALDILLDAQWHDGSLIYSWSKPDDTTGTENWWYKFSQIPESPAYKQLITKNEEVLYNAWKNKIRNIISDSDIKRIWDIWWSDGHKFTKIMDILGPKIIDNKTVITKDISPYLIDEHAKTLQERSHTKNINIQTTGVLEDFLSDDQIKIQKWEWRAFFVFGGSICNLPTDVEVIRFLQTLSSDKVRGSRDIFMTIHIAPDKVHLSPEQYQQEVEKILCAYGGYFPQNPHFSQITYDAIKDWISSGIAHYIGEKNMQFVEFETYWEDLWEAWWVVRVWVRVKESFSITTPTGIVTKQSWDFIEWISSKRYSQDSWNSIIQRAWYLQENFISSWYEWLGHLKTPEYTPINKTPEHKQLQNTIKTSLITTLLIGAGIWGLMKWITKEEKMQKEKDWIEAIDNYGNWYGSKYAKGRWYWSINWESLITNRQWFYEKIFKIEYNITDDNIEVIKYDFLWWLVEKMKSGNYITYGPMDTTGDDYDDIVATYIMESQNRIKHSLNISIPSRYEWLQSYEDILAQTVRDGSEEKSLSLDIIEKLKNDNEAVFLYKQKKYSWYKALWSYKALWNRMNGGAMLEGDIILLQENNRSILLARNKDWFHYSSRFAQDIARNYFTIPWTEKLQEAIKKYLKDDNGSYSDHTFRNIRERITNLRIDGLKLHADKYVSTNEYDFKIDYLLNTFCKDIIPKWNSDFSDLSWKIQNIISTLPQHLHSLWVQNKTLSPREQKLLTGRCFEALIFESDYIYGDELLSLADQKRFLLDNSDILFADINIDFPFMNNSLYTIWDMNLIEVKSRSNSEYISRELMRHEWESIWVWKGLYIKTPKFHTNKVTLPWRWTIHRKKELNHWWDYLFASLTEWDIEASTSPYFEKLVQHYIKHAIINKHGPGRSFEEQAIIEKWPHGNNTEAYNDVVEKRKQVKKEAREFLEKPNSYVAHLFYDEWSK